MRFLITAFLNCLRGTETEKSPGGNSVPARKSSGMGVYTNLIGYTKTDFPFWKSPLIKVLDFSLSFLDRVCFFTVILLEALDDLQAIKMP